MPLANKSSEVEKLLDKLVDSAKLLQSISQREAGIEEIDKVQEQQESYISQVLTWSQDAHVKANWHKLQAKVELFQKLNSTFVSNLKIRQGLVKKDLRELQSSKKSVKNVSKLYSQSNQAEKNQIDRRQ